MIRIVLACEGGTGLGHVDSLVMVAKALGPRFSFDGVHYSDASLESLSAVCETVFRCPATLPRLTSSQAYPDPLNLSWANFLERCNLGKTGKLAPDLAWWRGALRMREIDMVVCDYAPMAMLAARTLGIPVVLTGTAFSVPPDGLQRFPTFVDRETKAADVDEAAIVRTINAICGIRGLPEMAYLPQIYDCAVKLPQGLDFLDPYQGLRTEPLLPRPASFSTLLAKDGREIFVYLSHITADPDFMLDGLVELDAPVRVFVPWLEKDRADMLRSHGIMVEDKPQTPDDIARRTRLMVIYGQPSTTTMALASGLPVLAFPQHFEQSYHANRASRKGGVRQFRRDGLDKEGYLTAIRNAYADEDLFAAAQHVSLDVRRQLSVDAADMIRESLRPALVEIVKKKGLA
jgi:UDP:flavonoid glycosyltransferase YjiC (YdhE family)